MGEIVSLGPHDQDDSLGRAAEAEEARVNLIGQYRDRLRRAIALRLDRRVRRRVDSSDVLQDATIDALKRFDEYFQDPSMPLLAWLRFLAVQQVKAAHHKHLGAKQRDIRRELRPGPDPGPLPSSADLAAQLTLMVLNQGKNEFNDGLLVITLQKEKGQYGEFKGRRNLPLRAIPSGSTKAVSVEMALDRLEPAQVYPSRPAGQGPRRQQRFRFRRAVFPAMKAAPTAVSEHRHSRGRASRLNHSGQPGVRSDRPGDLHAARWPPDRTLGG